MSRGGQAGGRAGGRRGGGRSKSRGRGKGRGIGLRKIPGVDKNMRRTIKALGGLAYDGQLRDLKGEKKQIRRHGRAINRAYKAYEGRLGELGASQQNAYLDAQNRGLGVHTALEGIAANQTQAGVADAQRRAALLGQGDTVAQNLGAVGGNAAISRGQVAGAAQNTMADVGLAAFSDFGRRAATGQRDQIDSKNEQFELLQANRAEKRGVKKEKGQFMVGQLNELLQRQEENLLARLGLKIDSKQFNKEMRLENKKFRLDKRNSKHDRKEDRKNRKNDEKGDKGEGGDKGMGGLSPSQKEEYRRKVAKINSVISTYRNMIRRGVPPSKAGKKARKATSADRFMVTIAAQVVNSGGINSRGKHLVRGYLPGGPIPKKWK